jgi:hypothetical protein
MAEDFLDIVDKMVAMHEKQGISWDEIEKNIYHFASRQDACLAQHIQEIDLSEYKTQLLEVFTQAVAVAKQKEMSAIYFEYNLDNDWQSIFCLCPYYVPKRLSEGDPAIDDWACWYDEDRTGPDLPIFGKIFSEHRSDAAAAYLVARTIAAFDATYKQLKIDQVAICIAFHDQDPIIRIQDLEPLSEKLFDPKKHIPISIPTEKLTPLEYYVKSHFGYLVQGSGDIKQKIAQTLSRYPEEIFLNYCPFCGALRRTPKAKQCPECYQREKQ